MCRSAVGVVLQDLKDHPFRLYPTSLCFSLKVVDAHCKELRVKLNLYLLNDLKLQGS